MPSEDAAKIDVKIISNGVILEIDDERKRQIDKKGHSSSHDDMHDGGELRYAAAAYCLDEVKVGGTWIWPWDTMYWRAGNIRRNLIKAAALIVAEIERIDRAREFDERARKQENDRYKD